jgi:putative ABC transport system permease protein
MDTLKKSMIINFDLLKKDFVKNGKGMVSKAEWYYGFDYHKIRLDKNASLADTLDLHMTWIDKNSRLLKIDLPIISIIKQYSQRESQLKTTLLVLQVPVLLMLALYIFMISKLKIDYESNEIAVLKSRGASMKQVFQGYLVESGILGLIALLLGPPLGLMLCKVLGASNGFLEFVDRASLPVYLNIKTYLYALCAVAFFMVTMLVPAFLASRMSIVIYKHEKSRIGKKVFWKKYFLDVILVLISLYGIYGYYKHQKVLFLSGAKGTDISIDPLLFIVSFIFILGFGLLFLRLYPYLINFLFWLGKNKWSPVYYSTFIQVGRTAGQQQFLMIFLILTLSIGIFSSNTARTINKNVEEKIMYATGADIVVREHWKNNKPYGNMPGSVSPLSGDTSTASGSNELIYQEPLFEPYTRLSGVEKATKVYRQDDAGATINNEWLNEVSVMGIIPHEFGKIAWFRNDLLKAHWYNYLNLISDAPNAVLVSRSVKDRYKVKEGDTIYLKWGNHDFLEVVVYAFIDYWPTYNPNKKNGSGTPPHFVVANLDYIHARYSVEPYEVWLKKKDNATSNQVYSEITGKSINIEERKDSTEQIIRMKNDPMFQGTNGALTLDFLVTLMVCIIGFLIYWIMSIQKRTLQFGILRAMGLTLKKVLGMLLCEQILITGASVLFGIVLGNYVSKIFIPMLQLVYSSEEQLPPFKVIFEQSDYIRLYIFIGIMISIGFAVLGAIISRIKINQAIKLGED